MQPDPHSGQLQQADAEVGPAEHRAGCLGKERPPLHEDRFLPGLHDHNLVELVLRPHQKRGVGV